MIVVNVPEFVLRAYDYRDGKLDIRLEMKVIVGKALDTRTPLFEEDMRYIEFSPTGTCRPPSRGRNWCPASGAIRAISRGRASSSCPARRPCRR